MTDGSPISAPRYATPAGFAESASEGRWWRCSWINWLNRQVMQWLFDPTSERICAIEAPPRHGKSEYASIWLPAWFLGTNPGKKVILGSYSSDLVKVWGSRVRDIIAHFGPEAFGVMVQKDLASAEDWGISDVATGRPTGGLCHARGAGGQVTGLGAHLMILDDLIKGPEEADSPAHRDKIWHLVYKVFRNRLEPGGKILIPMARWHPDDPVGRMIKLSKAGRMRLRILRVPALCETQVERDRAHREHGLPEGLPDPLGRGVGESLWPERYPVDVLTEIREPAKDAFNSLFQQNPTPREGGMFQPAYFYGEDGQSRILDAMHWQSRHRVVARACGWDTAASTESSACHTAGVLLAKTADGLCVVEDVIRGQWSPGERNFKIRQTAEKQLRLDPAPEMFVEQEPGGGGKEAAQALIKYMAGLPFVRDRVHETKERRAQPMSTYAHEGNFRVVAAGWDLEGFVDELCAFPKSTERDRVDAATLAFNHLFVTGGREWKPEAITEAFAAPPRPMRGPAPMPTFEQAWEEAGF